MPPECEDVTQDRINRGVQRPFLAFRDRIVCRSTLHCAQDGTAVDVPGAVADGPTADVPDMTAA